MPKDSFHGFNLGQARQSINAQTVIRRTAEGGGVRPWSSAPTDRADDLTPVSVLRRAGAGVSFVSLNLYGYIPRRLLRKQADGTDLHNPAASGGAVGSALLRSSAVLARFTRSPPIC